MLDIGLAILCHLIIRSTSGEFHGPSSVLLGGKMCLCHMLKCFQRLKCDEWHDEYLGFVVCSPLGVESSLL